MVTLIFSKLMFQIFFANEIKLSVILHDELFAIIIAADEANMLEEEIANRIAIKFLVEDDAFEKRKFTYASDIVEGPGECNT
jgi:hypothetical protein